MSELVVQQTARPSLTRAVAQPGELISYHQEMVSIIQNTLTFGTDYGIIPGTGTKPSLWKPGAERLAIAFGCHPEYELVEKEIDHDRVNTYSTKYKGEQTSYGLYRFVYKAKIVRNSDGQVLGECHGVCSTLEAKYIARPRDSENTACKMAQKRAFVGAILHAFGLSDRFTQDVEDLPSEDDTNSYQRRQQAPLQSKPVAPQQAPVPKNFDMADPDQVEKLANYLTKDGTGHYLHDVAKALDGKPLTGRAIADLVEQCKAASARAAQLQQEAVTVDVETMPADEAV